MFCCPFNTCSHFLPPILACCKIVSRLKRLRLRSLELMNIPRVTFVLWRCLKARGAQKNVPVVVFSVCAVVLTRELTHHTAVGQSFRSVPLQRFSECFTASPLCCKNLAVRHSTSVALESLKCKRSAGGAVNILSPRCMVLPWFIK